MIGIDVSKHNGVVDFAKVKKAGIDFVIIRCGYGGNLAVQDDIKFETNYKNAKANGLKVGVYLYSYVKSRAGAESEADHVIRLLKGKEIDFPVWLDLEDETIKMCDWNTLAVIFANRIQKAGFECGIYTFAGALNKIDKIKDHYPIWIAKWGQNNGKQSIKNPGYDMWQYTSRGVVPGVNGLVDMNVYNKEVTNTVKAKPTIREIALDVLKGKYGDNEERKKALGRKYNSVQECINRWYTKAEATLKGKYGDKEVRKKKLGADYEGVQYLINEGVVK